MRQSVVKLFGVAIVLSIVSVLLLSCTTKDSNQANEQESAAVWTEVPVLEAGSAGTSSVLVELDPRKTIEEADYIFSGTIVDIKEYEVSFVDDVTGETRMWPYNMVLDVRVDKEYKGTNPVEGDTIKIYYMGSLSIKRTGSTIIESGASYLFITRLLHEGFAGSPEKHADVYLNEAIYSVSPIVDNTVFFNTKFFKNMSGMSEKSIEAKCDLVPEGYLEYKIVSAYKLEDFEPALAEMIKNPSLLPEGDFEWPEETGSS